MSRRFSIDPRSNARAIGRLGTRALPAVGASTALLAGFHVERRLRVPSVEVRDRYVRQWSHAMLRAFSIDRVFDPEAVATLRAKASVPRMIVANHRSTIDVFVLLSLFEGHLLARADLAEWPLMDFRRPHPGGRLLPSRFPQTPSGWSASPEPISADPIRVVGFSRADFRRPHPGGRLLPSRFPQTPSPWPPSPEPISADPIPLAPFPRAGSSGEGGT